MVYNLSSFPYHLCTHAIYWSASVDRNNHLRPSNLEVDVLQSGLRKFPGLKSANPFLRVFIGVEDDSELHRISHDAASLVNFTLKSLRWVIEHRYDGIFLRWTPPMKEGSSRFPNLIVHLLRTFGRVRGLTVGVVFPIYSASPDFYPDLNSLINVLEPHSIIVDPTSSTLKTSYFKSFFPYTLQTLGMYRDLFRRMVETRRSKHQSFCYPVSIAGYSLTLDDSGSSKSRRTPPVIVNHQYRSGMAIAAYDSTCRASKWNLSIRVKYGVLAARKSEWVAYQDKDSLKELLEALRNATGGSSCIGVWDPEFDDFMGHCASKPNPYPLTKTVFEGRLISFSQPSNPYETS